MRYLIGRYHEVALKGGNRWRFVDQIKHNLRAIFGDYELGRARSLGSRLLIELPDAIPDDIVRERAALIFGLQNFSISYPAPLDIEAITREAIARARGLTRENLPRQHQARLQTLRAQLDGDRSGSRWRGRR